MSKTMWKRHHWIILKNPVAKIYFFLQNQLFHFVFFYGDLGHTKIEKLLTEYSVNVNSTVADYSGTTEDIYSGTTEVTEDMKANKLVAKANVNSSGN